MRTRKKSTVAGASHSLLMRLWGQAVRKKWGGECILKDGTCAGQIEAHHFVRRKLMLTRYYVHNGFTMCHHHHDTASTIKTRQAIEEKAGRALMDELSALERESFKDYCVRRGMMRADFLRDAKRQLLEFLGDTV